LFRNYLATALRNIIRHKLYSFINIAGLAVGLACVIFIMLFIRDEISYDKWIPGSENLYRVESTINDPGRPATRGTEIPFPVPEAMLQQIPEVKAMTRLVPQSATVMIGSRQFLEIMTVVDPGFFGVIRLPLMQGDPATVFAQPESVVLSQDKARKYFGAAPAMGKIIVISGKTCDKDGANCQARARPLVVTGIMRDLPSSTQLKGDIFIPNTSAADPMSAGEKQGWMWFVGWGYVALAPGADPAAVETKLKTIIDRSLDPKNTANIDMRGSQRLVPHVVPFRDDHLSTDRYGGLTSGGSWTVVYGFAAIGALILLMACFNFMNLSTARATLRAREISLRKVMGARRRQLVVQFLGESVLVSLVALAFALALVEILLPAFNSFLGKAVVLHYLSDWPLVLAILSIAILAGLLSGIYPALVLSGFRPAATLRTSGSALSGSGLLRASLVVLQFAVSVGLGIAVAVVFAQISFSRSIALGYQKDGIVLVDTGGVPSSVRDTFAQALRANPRISATAVSDTVPLANRTIADIVARPGGHAQLIVNVVAVSPDFMDLYNVRLLSGRMLSLSRGADKHHAGTPYYVLINAAAARRLGYTPQSAIGKTFVVHATQVTVAGVVDDIKMDGPKQPVAATIYRYELNGASFVSVRVRPEHLSDTLTFIDRTWRAFAPTVAIQRSFLSDNFARQFQADERQGTIFSLFVTIAVFIACLGLFGLAAFTAERRIREIGIRKVFGARTRDLVFLLLWQFSIPVLIANLIAWPVAWYYLHDWLQGFAYRIALSPLYFLGAGAVALAIAWATVFVHALRVARANPIHALRYE
jgi:putative ABC transport system permease protein